MNNIIKKLASIADSLDKRGLFEESNIIDEIISNAAKKVTKLDPVGKEDDDIDNDGKKNTESDKYLKRRRKKIKESIDSRKKKKAKK